MKLSDFDDIRPYSDEEIRPAFEQLLADDEFNAVLKQFWPRVPLWFMHGLLRLLMVGVKTSLGFLLRIMRHVVNIITARSAKRVSYHSDRSNKWDRRYVFVSNHRDIVLDSAILDVQLFNHGAPTTCEIAIGDNLFAYDWIKRLVRMNKTFIVHRSLSPREMLKSSVLMSQYIHFAVNEKRENVWIAQREGRSKDSSDNTQESVLKMLAYGYEGSPLESLKHINIVPLTISYEYDPCDYLKAKEFQLKRDNADYKKSAQEDVLNMRTGIWGKKGRITYRCAPCINVWLDELEGLSAPEFFAAVAQRMDRVIHSNYELFPGNYIACDMLSGSDEYAAHYTKKDKKHFLKYLQGQLEKIRIPQKDNAFLIEKMLTMYANPVRNKFADGEVATV